jgi:hypothetical protein
MTGFVQFDYYSSSDYLNNISQINAESSSFDFLGNEADLYDLGDLK